MIRFFAVSIIFLMTACGQTSGSGDKNPSKTSKDALYSLFVSNESDLPTCDENSKDRLAYVSSAKQFKCCNGSSWETVEIAGPKGDTGEAGSMGPAGQDGAAGSSGLTIASIWRFHTDTYVGQDNIEAEAATTEANIGTVQLTNFSDGSCFVSVSGNQFYLDSENKGQRYDFSYQFFLKPSSSMQEYIAKFDIYANTRIRYRITHSVTATPTFKAVVDIDGNFDNNTDTTYTLTKVN